MSESIRVPFPFRITTQSGRHIVLQCTSEEHARRRMSEEYPSERVLTVEVVP